MGQGNVIDAIPELERKSYLELGVSAIHGARAASRTGVDVDHRDVPQGTTFHQMTTDAFFAGPGRDARFDVIYIDACHDADQVRRDYNHAQERLNPAGIILLHDLFPPDEGHTQRDLCSDAYKLLTAFIEMPPSDMELVVQNSNYGLTAVWNAKPVQAQAMRHLSYADFVELARLNLIRVSEEALIRWIARRVKPC